MDCVVWVAKQWSILSGNQSSQLSAKMVSCEMEDKKEWRGDLIWDDITKTQQFANGQFN